MKKLRNLVRLCSQGFGSAPLPAEDMPEDVKKDYEEAARIFIKSLIPFNEEWVLTNINIGLLYILMITYSDRKSVV